MSIQSLNKYRLSRRTKKLQVYDDQKVVLALPKDISERTWVEILQKEDNDLFLYDIREEILEEAMRIGYKHYMEKQTAFFTSHCVAKAWLKIIDWHFYRHDPGEEPSAYPPAYIPKRLESWIADEAPPPSPKDTWAAQSLVVAEETCEQGLKSWLSNESIDFPDVVEIEEEYWLLSSSFDFFICLGAAKNVECSPESDLIEVPLLVRFPGKVYFPGGSVAEEMSVADEEVSEMLAAESEVLQNVTDYTTEVISLKSSRSSLLTTPTKTPLKASMQGAGDSVDMDKKKSYTRRKSIALVRLRDKNTDSVNSVISDCRLRHLRLETQYEISPENIEPSQSVTLKPRK